MLLVFFCGMTAFAAPTDISKNQNTGQLFEVNKSRALLGMEGNARGVGDLITIQISEKTSTRVCHCSLS